MTFKIRKDLILGTLEAFDAGVKAHAAALNEYRAHLRGVVEDAENPNLKPEERRVAFPGPDASNLVKSAITLDGATDQYVPDYEIVGPPLAEKKQALFAQVTQMENAAIEANIPAAKRRYWQFRARDIAAADQARRDVYVKDNRKEDWKAADWDNVQEVVVAGRSAEDAIFLVADTVRAAKEVAIQRWAAKLHADIDDLSEATVDVFKIEPFSG